VVNRRKQHPMNELITILKLGRKLGNRNVARVLLGASLITFSAGTFGQSLSTPLAGEAEVWPGPEQRIAKIEFVGVPVLEAAEQLRAAFGEGFDLVVPSQTFETQINLKLRNPNAEEVFRAMNQLFVAERIPWQWKLKINGSRPIAVLQQLDFVPKDKGSEPPRPRMRMIVYVGDIVENEPGLDRLAETVLKIVNGQGGGKGALQVEVHHGVSLIVLSGDPDDVSFAREALQALRQREFDQRAKAAQAGASGRQGTPEALTPPAKDAK